MTFEKRSVRDRKIVPTLLWVTVKEDRKTSGENRFQKSRSKVWLAANLSDQGRKSQLESHSSAHFDSKEILSEGGRKWVLSMWALQTCVLPAQREEEWSDRRPSCPAFPTAPCPEMLSPRPFPVWSWLSNLPAGGSRMQHCLCPLPWISDNRPICKSLWV